MELALDFLVLLAEGKKLVKLSRAIAHSVKFTERLDGRDDTIEMNELHFNLSRSLPLGREVLGCDVGVDPVVVASFHPVFHTPFVVYNDGVHLPATPIRCERLSQNAGERLSIFRPAERDILVNIARQRFNNRRLKFRIKPCYL